MEERRGVKGQHNEIGRTEMGGGRERGGKTSVRHTLHIKGLRQETTQMNS